MTGIGWTDGTGNCLHGCTNWTEGCRNCYARWITYCLEHGDPQRPNAQTPFKGFGLTYVTERGMDLLASGVTDYHQLIHEVRWTGKLVYNRRPLTGKIGPRQAWQMWFLNSMSDVFHKEVQEEWIRDMWHLMRRAARHQFQVLTKRSERLLEMSPRLDWSPNVWAGASVEDDRVAYRLEHLFQTGAFVKIASFEPLIGRVTASVEGLDWAIIGGESGPGFRRCEIEWMYELVEKCDAAGVAVFVKQASSLGDGARGSKRDGLWIPDDLWARRDFPAPGDNPLLRHFYTVTQGKAAVWAARNGLRAQKTLFGDDQP